MTSKSLVVFENPQISNSWLHFSENVFKNNQKLSFKSLISLLKKCLNVSKMLSNRIEIFTKASIS
jgi:hypothetical protein